MAARELRASWRRLAFFFVCISIGVAAIVALRSIIQNVRAVFAGEARTLIAADAVISTNRPPDREVIAKIERRLQASNASVLRSVEVATMVRPADRPQGATRMAELRGIEAGFPYYGTLKLRGGQPFQHNLLRNFGALARPELLAQLGVEVGDELLIANRRFVVRGVIESEPGRRLGAFSLGPRVFVDLANLEATGLLTFGARASYQQLVKVPDAQLQPLVALLQADLADTFVRVRSYETTEGDIGEDFARAENYLSLVGLVIVILGGIGVSSVTRVFVQQKMRTIAILKCLGARSAQLLAIYMAQVVLLGLLGSVLGVMLAAAAVRAIPYLVTSAALQALNVSYTLTAASVVQGLGIGLLVSLLFALVPLLDVRHVKPSLLLREESRARSADLVTVVVTLIVAGGLVAVTVWQAGSLRVGGIVALGFAGAALVLHLAGRALIRIVAPLAKTRWFAVRHAVLQLSRPGSQAGTVLLAVGLGSFFVVGVRSLQQTLIGEFTVNMAADTPDMFLLDVQADQVDPLRAFLQTETGAAAPRLIPVLRARVTGVEGRDVTLDNYEDVRGRGSLGREYTVTYRPTLERNEETVAGAFWDGSPRATAEVSIEESVHERFGIQVGDVMRFDILGRVIEARVTSVRRVDWADSRSGGFMFVFRPGVLEAAPHSFIGFLRGPAEPTLRGKLQGRLVAGFPNVSVIDGREMLDAIRTIVDNVTLAVSIVGTLVVLSGLLILAGAVAMTNFRRVYEAAIFKTLGATRSVIASILLLEYGLLGALAGTIGSFGALALTWGISRFALDIPWRPLPLVSTLGIVACTVLVAGVGVSASWKVLQHKPLATLRAE